MIRRLVPVGLFVVSAAGSLLPGLVSPAFAQFKDDLGNIHFQTGIAPNAAVEVSAGELKRSIRGDFCGIVSVGVPTNAPMPGTISVDGVSINVAGLPVLTKPSCKDNTLAEPRAANFKDATGRVHVVSKTPGISYEVIYPGVPSLKTYRANVCGLARIGNSATNPAPATFTYNGTAYTTASLPVQVPARCIQGVKFVPAP